MAGLSPTGLTLGGMQIKPVEAKGLDRHGIRGCDPSAYGISAISKVNAGRSEKDGVEEPKTD